MHLYYLVKFYIFGDVNPKRFQHSVHIGFPLILWKVMILKWHVALYLLKPETVFGYNVAFDKAIYWYLPLKLRQELTLILTKAGISIKFQTAN